MDKAAVPLWNPPPPPPPPSTPTPNPHPNPNSNPNSNPNPDSNATTSTQKAPQNLESADEVEAYLAERRRRFPTKTRIEEKSATAEALEQQGSLEVRAPEPKRAKREAKGAAVDGKRKAHDMVFTAAPNLLQRLYADEIRTQQSLVLQLFRRMVQCGFSPPQNDPS